MTVQDYNRLKRVQRDIRATRAEPWHHVAPVPSNAAGFAKSVLGRYGGSTPGRVGMLERVYRRLAFGLFLQRIYQQATPVPTNGTRVSLALTIVRSSDAPGLISPEPVTLAALMHPANLSLIEQVRDVLTLRVRHERRVEALAQQIVTRTRRTEARITTSMRRVEAGAGSPSTTTTSDSFARPAATNPPPLPAISRELVRRQVPNGESPAVTGAGEQAVMPAARRSAAANPLPVDVNDLTEQVIRAIDQRIIAQRERLGRN